MSSLLEAIKNKRQAIQAKQGRERPLKLLPGKNILRILPRWDGNEDGQFWQDFGQHFVKDSAGKVIATYVCTQVTLDTPCEVCAAIQEHSVANTDETKVKILEEARSSNRILINGILRNSANTNASVSSLVELPPSVLNDVLAVMENYLEEHQMNLLSLDEGFDLTIEKSGAGLETRYKTIVSPKASKVPDGVMGQTKDLAAYAQQEYSEGLQRIMASLNSVVGIGHERVADHRPTNTRQTTVLQADQDDNQPPTKTLTQKLAEQEPVEVKTVEPEKSQVEIDTDDLDSLLEGLAI